MRHHLFEENPTNRYSIAVLSKSSSFNRQELLTNYVIPMQAKGIKKQDVIGFTLEYNSDGKAPAGFIKDYLDKLLPALKSLGVKYLFVTDSSYFKVLTKQLKADPHFGYAMPCKYPGFEDMEVVLSVNYAQLFYSPSLQAKLTLSLDTLAARINGSYAVIGSTIIHSARYPQGVQEIAQALESLHQYPELSADIEGFSLRFNEAGIGTIAFAWDKHNGLAFACDYFNLVGTDQVAGDPYWGVQYPNPEVRKLLLNFFLTYKGKLTWHNAPYDLKAIIFALWMKDFLDTEGLLTGLDTMTRSFDDTKIISYLATNSTAGNELGLKALAHEFAGNWAVDVKDIRQVPIDKLLQYNLVDALSTNYVKEKNYPVMVRDNQEKLYHELMLPSLKLIIQIELTGMPMSDAKIQEIKAKLEAYQQDQINVLRNSNVIKALTLLLQRSEWEKDYEDRKAKAKNPGKILPKQLAAFDTKEFNPNSGPQLQRLLYEQMGLPVIDLTDTKQPATGAETIEKLINHTQEPAYKDLLQALINYGKVTKILSTFIPAFERGIMKADGMRYLHGNFNLGGTVSGRLSSSEPNLQNIPANSHYAKLIKSAFMAAYGWLFCGADFNSLEDYVSALTTKDPNKLKVYQGEVVYELTIDGINHHIRGDTRIRYDGEEFTGDEFYDFWNTHRPL